MSICHSIFILSVMYCCTSAVTEEDLKMDLTRLVMKCGKNMLDMNELLLLQQYVTPTKTETKCILACAYKESGMMTSDGKYNLDQAYKIAEMIKNGKEERMIKGKEMADICVKVNDVKVSDGEKGCERAALMFKCIIENAPKFGFKI